MSLSVQIAYDLLSPLRLLLPQQLGIANLHDMEQTSEPLEINELEGLEEMRERFWCYAKANDKIIDVNKIAWYLTLIRIDAYIPSQRYLNCSELPEFSSTITATSGGVQLRSGAEDANSGSDCGWYSGQVFLEAASTEDFFDISLGSYDKKETWSRWFSTQPLPPFHWRLQYSSRIAARTRKD